MSKSLRLSEKWFRRALWLVAFVFAAFLIGLGGTIVSNLPKVERQYSLDDFIDQKIALQARTAVKEGELMRQEAQDALEREQLKLNVARADARTARETLNSWLATRHVTTRADQDTELLRRTRELEKLKADERRALADVQAQEQVALNARQSQERAQRQLHELETEAASRLQAAERAQELRVFLYRLALTLPLLALAGWLFAKKSKSTYWPFVWGFIIFALFIFFVELVPYLPSYGGYVRYTVGIIVTVLVGRYAILSLNRYLERQKLQEQRPDIQRREEMDYDLALSRLAKGVCPGCERSVDLKDKTNDYCPHCGIRLHDYCVQCNTRKGSFAKFCHSCGTRAAVQDRPQAGTTA